MTPIKKHIRLLGALLLLPASGAFSHTVRNKISSYDDTEGVSKNRYKIDANINLEHEKIAVTQTAYTIAASQERFEKKDITEDQYMQDVYGGRTRVTDTVSLGASQTWSKVTDTRCQVGYSSDGVMRSRTGGVGIGHWFWHDNLQLNADISRTLVEAPVFEVLGADSDVISPPEMITSTGTTISSKYLLNPTTISTLSYTHIEKNDRPPTNIYGFGLRKYLTKTKSAVHFDGARAFNQGRVTTKTNYGEVNAWIGELSFLQTLWRGANSKFSYRYYREDETTRVENDQHVRGSDLVSVYLSQELNKSIVDVVSTPLVIEASGSRYKTNELESGHKLAANIYEVGVLAKF